jgi:hypothetical protein
VRLNKRLQSCKNELTRWNNNTCKESEWEIKQKMDQLTKLQGDEDEYNGQQVGYLKEELHMLLEQENLRWQQKSKELWLKDGDRNTKYFNASATQKRRRNRIEKIMDVRGCTWERDEDIENAFINFFRKVYTSEPTGDMSQCLQGVTGRVTPEMNCRLTRAYSHEEIREAIFQMSPLKAHGPDGYSAGFFQDNWPIVGEEVCQAIFTSLNSGILNTDLNFTYIALIPKKQDASIVSDFRPISLCNVLYKIISKVLANKLKEILPKIISATQSAFIPGRLITDNILAAYETLHTMHSRMYGKKGYMAVKLDMSKAYDRVEWHFLEAVMVAMGFAEEWVKLIMMCVRTANYSVLVNGIPVGKIWPTRGIRQGDPISPYLFLLCAEALSSQLSRADEKGELTGVPTSKLGLRLNHLFFCR